VRPVTAGWQLPYLRLALILRVLEQEDAAGPSRPELGRELAHVRACQVSIARAGWFN
jgi:hypothetical protein